MRLHTSLGLVSVVAMVAATPAAAYAQSRSFDVASQPAATGIVAFARQAGIQIIAPQDATRGRRVAAIRGSMTVADGLRRMTAAAGLRLVSFDGRTAVLAAGAAPMRANLAQQPAPSGAQTSPAENPATPQADNVNQPGEAPTDQVNDELNEIVVTGTRARGTTVLTSSSAITVATREDLDRKAPRSTAQALELIPGIFVEGSGGEVSNNFSVRGLAGGGQQFVQLQEDGLPVFYINALSDTILKQEVFIDRLEAVRSGSSGILTVNGAGATINFITRKPDFDKSGGTFQLTTSSFGTARVDAFMTKPLGENTAIALGGFYRKDDGIRDPGYDANHGFIFRGAIAQRWDSGKLTLSAKVVDDHNTFFVPIPVTGVGNPRSIPGLSATHGLLQSNDFSLVRTRTSATTGRSFEGVDLEDGVHTRSQSYGYDLTQDFGESVNFFARGRYTRFRTNFNSIFSYDNSGLQLASERLNTNPLAGPVNATSALTLRTFAPRGAGSLALRYVDTGQVIQGTAALNAINGNGLIAESVIGDNKARVKEFNSDTGITWETQGDTVRNSLTVGGLFTRSRRYNDAIGAATFLSDVQDRARRVDVVAVNAAGNVVGSLTENGFLNYGTFGEGASIAKFTSISGYATDQLTLWDKLRLDGGIRFEHFVFNRRGGNTTGATPIAGQGTFGPGCAIIQDNDNIIANNCIAQFGGGSFDGTFSTQRREFNKIAWTAGANYLLTDRFAVYGRYATGFQAQEQNRPTNLRFAEGGLRYASRLVQASLTGFYTKFLDYPQSRDVQTTVNGAAVLQQLTANAGIKVFGGEFDVTLRPVSWFRIQATGVIQDSKIDIRSLTAFQNGNPIAVTQIAQSLRDQVNGFDGNKPERTPAVNVNVTPSIVLPNDIGEIYGSWKHIGKIYADISNSLVLPGYDVFGAGVLLKVADGVTFNASVENIGNTVGLTEGNPRAGFVENTGSNFYFARPINGTNAIASLRFDF